MREIDEYQKAAIKADFNAVVSAGAGSGKTTVLSERFTDLVLNRNCEVDQILTLTFTKKATVEMSSRIYKVLKEKAPKKARDFYKANIKTIDSYCNSVAKMGCHLYGIAPDFKQDEKAVKKSIENLALPFILEHRDSPAIKALVKTKDYAQITNELFVEPFMADSTIAEPIDFEKGLELQKEEIIFAWKKLSQKNMDILSQLYQAYRDFDGNSQLQFMLTLSSLLDDGVPEQPLLKNEDIEKSDSRQLEEFTLAIKKIANISLKGAPKKGGEELKEIIKSLRTESDSLISLCNYVSGFSITKELTLLLDNFQNKINDLKRTMGLLTFKDIASLAVCILRDFPEIRQVEKEKYKAIMIDEFQDNNSQQRDLLFMLSEKLELHNKGIPCPEDLCPDKLFFVGDEKQSIYRFRGADVSVFRALSQDFKDGNLSMEVNYRSHPSLIKAFNIIFGGELPVFFTQKDEERIKKEEECGLQPELIPAYEAVYHNVKLPKNAPAKELENPDKVFEPHIHIARYDTKTNANENQIIEEEAEANWVCEKIKELAEKGVNGKKYQPQDIVILFRSYNLQPLYERKLLEHGIPYNTETVTGFFNDGLVNDVFSFLRICVYENDRFSYGQVLCSPFVNLSVEEAEALLLEEESPFSEKGMELLTGDSLQRYLHAKAFYEDFKESSKTDSLTTCISKLWYGAGYRYETLWNTKVYMYNKMYDLIFELARQSELLNMSLSDFVDSVRVYEDQNGKLENMDIPLDKAAGVSLMSIHKSKGLEYPVVFICGTHKKGVNDSNAAPVFSSERFGITVNTPPCKSFPDNKSNYFYDSVVLENKKKENAELRRLVYVAVTRAISELYITNGKYADNPEAADKYYPGSEIKLDTIYHTLEPIINYYENGDSNETIKKFGFFDVENIPPYDLEEVEKEAVNESRNTPAAKAALINSLIKQKLYENAEVIEKEAVPKKYLLPSQLHEADEESIPENWGKDYLANNFHFRFDLPFSEINKIVEASAPRFGFNNFGTIAHAYMEALITGQEPVYSNREIIGLENQERDLPVIKAACSKMQEMFKNSDLGKAAIKSKWHKSEYSFRNRIGEKIVKGSIDLVFQEDDGNYSIVDYKTNQSIEPSIYFNQLACYRHAIAQMMGVKDEKNIRCFLYYLRFGKAVDITENCDSIDCSVDFIDYTKAEDLLQ